MTAILKYFYVLMLFCTNVCWGQTGKSFLFHYYDNSNGLSSYNVRKIVQDDFGFMWIATQDGLNFFDGRDFKIFRNSGRFDRKIADNVVMDMAIQPGKSLLWLCLPYAGIQAINLNTHASCDSISSAYFEETLGNSLLTTISFSQTGNQLWIGHSEGWGVFDLQQHKVVYSSRTDPHLAASGKEYVVKIVHSGTDKSWVCTRNGMIYLYQRAPFKLLQSFDLFQKDAADRLSQINDVIAEPGGNLLMATTSGLQGLTFNQQS